MEFAKYDKVTQRFIYDPDSYATIPEFRDVSKNFGDIGIHALFLMCSYTSPVNNPSFTREEKVKKTVAILLHYKKSEYNGTYKVADRKVTEDTLNHPIFKKAEEVFRQYVFDQDWENYHNALEVERTLSEKYRESVGAIVDKDGADYTKVLQTTFSSSQAHRKAMEEIVFNKLKDKKGNNKVVKSYSIQ